MEYSCSYVVARLVNDPMRGEGRNFGVILQCLEIGYVEGLFETNLRDRLATVATPGDVETVQAYIADWRAMIAGFKGTSMGLPLPGPLESSYLRTLWEGYSERVQFTEPRGCVAGLPREMLEELFRQLVSEPVDGPSIDEHVTFRQEFSADLRAKHLIGPKKVRPYYEVAIGRKSVPVDFGYKTAKYEVLIETVDLTGDSLLDRINKLSPTAVKFEIAKTAKGRAVKTYSAVKTSSNGHSQSVHRLELEALGHHADEVFLMSKVTDRDRLWATISGDVGVPQSRELFASRRLTTGASKKK